MIALILAIVIPTFFLSATHCGNETPAIVTLRNLASAQAMFRGDANCDLDGDGVGEFGTLGEMTGADGVRADATGARRKARLKVLLLSASLAAVNEDGIANKSGYCFRIFLPGTDGGAVHEGKASGDAQGGEATPPPVPEAGPPFTGPVGVDASEKLWCAYAWPYSHGNSGNRVFFVREAGDVWQMANTEGRYNGPVAGPDWNAAMPADKAGWADPPRAKEYRGRDGNDWKRVE